MKYIDIKNNKVRNLVIFVGAVMCVSSFFIDVGQFGFSNGSTWERVTYMFASAGILHYLVNVVSFYLLYNLAESTLGFKYLFVFFLIGILATFGAEMSEPTVGLSAVVFGMFGLLFYFSPVSLRDVLVVVVGQSLLCYYLGLNLNLTIHANAFFYGLLFAIIYKYTSSWKQRKMRKF